MLGIFSLGCSRRQGCERHKGHLWTFAEPKTSQHKTPTLEDAASRCCHPGTAILFGVIYFFWPHCFLMGHGLPTVWSALKPVVNDFESHPSQSAP